MTEQELLDIRHFSFGGEIELCRIPKRVNFIAEFKLFVIHQVRVCSWRVAA